MKNPKRPSRYIEKDKNIERETPRFLLSNEIPHEIVATYSSDYNILYIHDIILSKLQKEKEELPLLEKKKEFLERTLENPLTMVERKRLTAQLENITSQIDAISFDKKLNTYLQESKEYLEKYRQMGPVIKVKSFTKKESTIGESDERLSIIRKYITIAEKYIPIDVIQIIPNDRTCPGCKKDLVLVDPENYTLERCPECGYERLNFAQPAPSREERKVTSSDYIDRENFTKAFVNYLGEQEPPGENLFQALDEWAISYGHPPKEEVVKMPLNKDGTRGDYGKTMLLQALSDTSFTNHYSDYRLIGHLYWGWKLPVMSPQEREIIFQDYDATQTVFRSLPRERKSSLNTQYRLYRHLEARGYDVSPANFKLPTTPGIIEEHDACWKEMVKVIPNAKYRSLK